MIRSILKLIGYTIGAFIFYVLLCMLWGALYRFYHATFNNRRTTYEEEVEFGASCFNVLIVIFLIDFGIGYFSDIPAAGTWDNLTQGVHWYQRLLEVTLIIPFMSLTIVSIVIVGLFNYE